MVDLNKGHTRLIIEQAMEHGLLRNQLAYVLATACHETAGAMVPIKETVMSWHRNKNPSDATVIKRLNRAYEAGKLPWVSEPYWNEGWFGRGFVQLTHAYNYERAGKNLDIDLMTDPGVAMNPEISAQILVCGSRDGWFTGKRLSDYIDLKHSDFVNARRIINGKDRADTVAKLAKQYDNALLAEGYGIT